VPFFKYTAISLDGKEITNVLEAADRDAAVAQLQRQKLTVTKIKKTGSLSAKSSRLASKVNQSDVLAFSRQMSTLVKAKLPIEQCLEVVTGQVINPAFKTIVQQIKDDVIAGDSLSTALSKHPKVFSTLYVGLVKSGEASGRLPEILIKAGQYLERAARLRRKIAFAMIYPCAVIALSIGLIFFVTIVVIPQFKNMYATVKGDLPRVTKIMVAVSDILRAWFLHFPQNVIFLGVLVMIFLAGRGLSRNPRYRGILDGVLMNLPVIGLYMQKIAFARFSSTLGILVNTNVPILDSFELVAETVGLTPLKKHILEVKERVKEGEKIAEVLRRHAIFPPLIVQMVHVGEQTGNLGGTLEQVAEFYEEEIELSTSTLISLIEPALVIGLAVIVGFLLIAIYLPVIRLATLVRRG